MRSGGGFAHDLICIRLTADPLRLKHSLDQLFAKMANLDEFRIPK